MVKGEGPKNDFDKKILEATGSLLHADRMDILQVNVGHRCNHRCTHCHVQASPERDEVMGWEVMRVIIDLARKVRPQYIDITGGAPEMVPDLKRFVKALRKDGHKVQVRTNLTILLEPGMEDMIGFYKDQGVRLMASLPCYEAAEVDSVRGDGVFDRSIEALKRLNKAGFGRDPGLVLDLAFNPEKDFLPPPQADLEKGFKEELSKNFGVVFNGLITITNMPIGRFAATLKKEDLMEDYHKLLRDSFNPATIGMLMCLSQIDVGWDGRVYDCDFNLAQGLTVGHGTPTDIREFDPSKHIQRRIVTGNYCFGCTAGAGSSCSGALQK